ncbi:MAG: sigma-70 family RNA polymerase sigma factor [Bacteroidota bacterium]
MTRLHRHTTPEEENRAVQAARKDPRKFSVLYHRYHQPVFVFVFKRVSDPDITADITSQVFLKAMVNLPRYRYRGLSFGSWLFRIAVSEVNQHFRNAGKRQEVPLYESELSGLMEQVDIDPTEQQMKLMVEALNQLDAKSVEMIELRFFEKYAYRQLGAHFGSSEDNAKVRVYRIVKKLKKLVTLMQQP